MSFLQNFQLLPLLPALMKSYSICFTASRWPVIPYVLMRFASGWDIIDHLNWHCGVCVSRSQLLGTACRNGWRKMNNDLAGHLGGEELRDQLCSIAWNWPLTTWDKETSTTARRSLAAPWCFTPSAVEQCSLLFPSVLFSCSALQPVFVYVKSVWRIP